MNLLKLNICKINQELYSITIFVLIVLLMSVTFIPYSFAVSDLSIKIPRDNYVLNDSVYVSGTLYAASSDVLTLKIYDNKAKLIWTNELPIGTTDTEFNYTLVLSGSDWENSGLYVILAEIDNVIASTKFTFDLTQDNTSIQNQNSTTKESEPIQTIDADQLAQQIVDQLTQQIVDQLTQQIATLLSSSQQQLDADQLTQQIADKIALQQPPIVEQAILNHN